MLQTLNLEIGNSWEKICKNILRFSELHVSLLSFTLSYSLWLETKEKKPLLMLMLLYLLLGYNKIAENLRFFLG
jgi:hypothetical protein